MLPVNQVLTKESKQIWWGLLGLKELFLKSLTASEKLAKLKPRLEENSFTLSLVYLFNHQQATNLTKLIFNN